MAGKSIGNAGEQTLLTELCGMVVVSVVLDGHRDLFREAPFVGDQGTYLGVIASNPARQDGFPQRDVPLARKCRRGPQDDGFSDGVQEPAEVGTFDVDPPHARNFLREGSACQGMAPQLFYIVFVSWYFECTGFQGCGKGDFGQ